MPRSYAGNYGSRFGRDDPKLGKRTFDKPFRDIVREADVDWERDRVNEVEYEFSGPRRFKADPHKRGVYGS